MSSNRGLPLPPEPAKALAGPKPSNEVSLSKPDPEVPAVKPELKRDNGIKVVATRDGWYGNVRRALGDRFLVASEKKLGGWMRCEDPKLEAKRQKSMRAKKNERHLPAGK